MLSPTLAAAEVRVVGTDLLGIEFSKAIYAFAGRHAFPVALAFDGTRPGLDELNAGRADVALLARPDDATPLPAAFVALPVAYHRVTVLVPAACPLAQLTVAQLADAFGLRGASIPRWSDLGLTDGTWTGEGIALFAPEDGRGVTLDLFRHVVLRDREFRPRLVRYRGAPALVSCFRGEVRGLALADAMPSSAGLKAVPIAMSAREPAFLPTPENVCAGDYPLRLPICLVFRRESAAKLRPLLRFLVTDAAPPFERAGVLPLPASFRAQTLARLEKM